MSAVHINTGGAVEWIARHHDCRCCFHRTTHYGRAQAWYDTDWTCGRCGARNGQRIRSARVARERAVRVRTAFVAWLLAGSPRLELP